MDFLCAEVLPSLRMATRCFIGLVRGQCTLSALATTQNQLPDLGLGSKAVTLAGWTQ